MSQYAIELKGITKTFGSVVANNNIELNVKQGEILALLGGPGQIIELRASVSCFIQWGL